MTICICMLISIHIRILRTHIWSQMRTYLFSCVGMYICTNISYTNACTCGHTWTNALTYVYINLHALHICITKNHTCIHLNTVCKCTCDWLVPLIQVASSWVPPRFSGILCGNAWNYSAQTWNIVSSDLVGWQLDGKLGWGSDQHGNVGMVETTNHHGINKVQIANYRG